MDDESRGNWLALREDDGRAYLLRRAPGEVKIKGLGRFDALRSSWRVIPWETGSKWARNL